MLTGTTFEAVVILALIAVVHTFVSSFIVARLTASEKTEAKTSVQATVSGLSVGCRPTISCARRPEAEGRRRICDQLTSLLALFGLALYWIDIICCSAAAMLYTPLWAFPP